MGTTNETPRVWIGSLAAYNAGSLIGAWFDAVDAPTDSRAWVDAMAEQGVMPTWEPEAARERMAQVHEEIWVMDFEGFDGLLAGECSPSEAQRLAELHAAIDADGYDVTAVVAWRDHTGNDLQEWDAPTSESFQDAYCGEWGSREEYAQDLAEDCGMLENATGWPCSYIDWERAARDLFMDYYDASAPSGIYVFRAY